MSPPLSQMQADLLALFDSAPEGPKRTVCPNCINDRPGGWVTEIQPMQICRGCALGYFREPKEDASYFIGTFGYDHYKDVLGVKLARQGRSALARASELANRWIEEGRKSRDADAIKLGEALGVAVFWGYVAFHGKYPEDGRRTVEDWLAEEKVVV